jgi:hypothetical protein
VGKQQEKNPLGGKNDMEIGFKKLLTFALSLLSKNQMQKSF